MTSTPKPVQLLPYDLDTNLVKHALTEVETAIHDQDYAGTFKLASQALPCIQQSIATMIDIRIHASLKQGKIHEAIKDAEDMIKYKPNSATGYLRLGTLYGMQGKQQSAMDTYDLGLQRASADHPDYPRMIDGKEQAMERNKVRVDFIARLPFEIMYNIIALLPSKTKSTCLTVSRIWCNNIVRCSTSYSKAMTIDDTSKGLTLCMAPSVTHKVEDLTFTTENRPTLVRVVHSMSTGNFSKLKSLKLQTSATKNIDGAMIMLVSRALWQISCTLTTLVLDLHEDAAIVTVVDVLSACTNLTKLEYTTTAPLSCMIGEIILLKPHSTLVDMQLKAKTIMGQDLQKLLPSCHQLRRLILCGSDTTVLDIVDKICPNLETLAYNPRIEEVQKLEHLDTKRSLPGLYRFYTKNGGTSESASKLFPLIRRNMHSLKFLYINISDEDSPSSLNNLYSDLKLENLEQLTFWDCGTGTIQPLILQSISTCTKLTHVEAAVSQDIPGLVDALVDLPQSNFFGLSHISSTVGETDLIRLLEVYARDSQSGQRRLRTIRLRYCKSIVTNNVLVALAGINTLEDITLEGLASVSARGMANFFKKLGNKVTKVVLAEIDAITDNSLAIIGTNMKCLKTLILKKLKKISDAGIMELANQSPELRSLTIEGCGSVTQDVITNVKEKVKNVVFTQ